MRAADAHAAFARFPDADLDGLLGTGGAGAVVLAPHPDDESLGCGGLIALAAASGRPCRIAVVSDGARSHPGSRTWPPARLAALREQEARAAAAVLGLPPAALRWLGLPDTRVPRAGPGLAAAVDAVATLLGEAPAVRVLIAAWDGDPHGDHVATTAIARAAARRTGARLLLYPVWGLLLPPDAPVPGRAPLRGWRLPLDEATRARKREAVRRHRSQHGLVVADDPGGFVLPETLLLACGADEVFIADEAVG